MYTTDLETLTTRLHVIKWFSHSLQKLPPIFTNGGFRSRLIITSKSERHSTQHVFRR